MKTINSYNKQFEDLLSIVTLMSNENPFFKNFLSNQDRKYCSDFFLYNGDRSGISDLENKYNVSFCAGASRLVIVFNDYDYVVKIPFLCNNGRFQKIVDHCRIEVDKYEKAKQEKLDYLFAETGRLGRVYFERKKSVIIYYMKKVTMDEDFITDSCIKTIKSSEYLQDNYKCQCEFCQSSQSSSCSSQREPTYSYNSEDIFELCFAQFLSDEELERALFFLEVEDIHDLHEANIGIINNKPILIDYAGYHG